MINTLSSWDSSLN